jgi:hypothetical protein
LTTAFSRSANAILLVRSLYAVLPRSPSALGLEILGLVHHDAAMRRIDSHRSS